MGMPLRSASAANQASSLGSGACGRALEERHTFAMWPVFLQLLQTLSRCLQSALAWPLTPQQEQRFWLPWLPLPLLLPPGGLALLPLPPPF